MSQTSDTGAADATALIQRLVVGRLASPGVLNRNQLHDTYDRFSQSPTRHTPRYVLRATEALPPSAPGLPFARIAQPSDDGATSAGATESTARASGTIARTPLLLTESPRAVLRADATSDARSASNTNVPNAAAIATSGTRAAPGHSSVMRAADSAIPVARTANSSTHSAGTRAAALQASPASLPSSHLSGSSHSALPVVRQRPSATPPDHSSAELLVRVAESRPSETVSSSPFGGLGIWPQTLPSSSRTVSPSVMRTPAPLIFRQPEPLAAASNSAPPPNTVKPPPVITQAASNVVAREVAAPQWAHKSAAHPKVHAGVSHYVEAPKVEQVIERVERHLARQLEIESERQGVRQWR